MQNTFECVALWDNCYAYKIDDSWITLKSEVAEVVEELFITTCYISTKEELDNTIKKLQQSAEIDENDFQNEMDYELEDSGFGYGVFYI